MDPRYLVLEKDPTAQTSVSHTRYESGWRVIRRCFVTQTVADGDVGVVVPYYNTTYASVPVYAFTKASTGLTFGGMHEVGVVELSNWYDRFNKETGAANSFVSVVTQGRVTARCVSGRANPIAPGDPLQYSINMPGALIKETTGQQSVYVMGVALQAVATGTTATSGNTAEVFLRSVLGIVNSTSITQW